MGKYVSIRKVNQQDNKHTYEVQAYEENEPFYIVIDPDKKQILYFADKNLTKHVTTIILNSEDAKLIFPGIDRHGAVLSYVKASKAIDKNEFPEILDYCA